MPQTRIQTQPVTLPEKLPVRHEAQVMVVGGGPGGIGAAVAAAREGADVLLIEHYGFLGGMATAGEVNPFMPNHLDGQSLDTGIFQDWLDRIDTYGGLLGNSRVFDPNIARLAAEDLCLEAGVRLLYHHRTAHAQTRDRRLDAVVLHSKSGLELARAGTFIDATGDGDLAALAGCRFEIGKDNRGACQPMTLCFKLKLDPRDAPEGSPSLFSALQQQREQINQVYRDAQASGEIECPRENVLTFRGCDEGVVHFNTTRVLHKSGIRGDELSEAEIIGRRQMRQIITVLRERLPLFRHARLYSVAPQIGIRETRRIIGREYLTVEDFKQARTRPDAVARVTYMIDIHNPDGQGTEHIHMPGGLWYDVPWGCLLPADLDNLAIGSRCISADHGLHSSVRVMPPVCSIGQAAGTAAAMALAEGVDICAIDGRQLKQRLIERGRNLVPYEPRGTIEEPGDVAARREAAQRRTAARMSA